jgi:phage FluMu protein Com
MNTKHSNACTRVFKRYDLSCPRCQELNAGSAPRFGWQAEYYTKKRQDAEARTKAIKQHFATGGPHDLGHCGPVCTAFDW